MIYWKKAKGFHNISEGEKDDLLMSSHRTWKKTMSTINQQCELDIKDMEFNPK